MGFLNTPQVSQAAPGLLSGLGGLQQADYMSSVARNNASIARQNAQATTQAGDYNASTVKMRGGEVAAQEQAAQGANNIDVNVGSAAAVRNSTERISAMDAAMVQYNAARAAYGMETQARADITQSKLDKMAGRNALFTGVAKSTGAALTASAAFPSSYATTGKALTGKWANYPQDGGGV